MSVDDGDDGISQSTVLYDTTSMTLSRIVYLGILIYPIDTSSL